MNDPEYIILHHSFTKDGEKKDWDAIREYHIKTNGWNDIGYHYGIELYDGRLTIMVGRRESLAGAHTKELGMNSRSIGICVVGNYDEAPPPLANLDLLAYLCVRIMRDYGITPDRVIGHRDVGLMAGFDWKKGQYKTCPGRLFSVDAFRKMLKGVSV
jgi:N-acetyl-anhydromuramyl-L-alanine amidase AmpD